MTAHRPYERARLAGVAVATLTACRFGGPSADPEAYVSFPGDASAMLAGVDASMSAPPAVDAGSVPGEAGGQDRGAPGPTGVVDAMAGDARASCSEAGSSVPVCDPVRNTGCNLFQQCDVDPNKKTTPTGLCLFNSPQDGGQGPCLMSLVSESCPPKTTCVSGACHPLCACDGDCPAGECCS
ncbi:MAG: hypothetical protein ACREJ3_04445, partial [Polyangiaceae bacterium]